MNFAKTKLDIRLFSLVEKVLLINFSCFGVNENSNRCTSASAALISACTGPGEASENVMLPVTLFGMTGLGGYGGLGITREILRSIVRL